MQVQGACFQGVNVKRKWLSVLVMHLQMVKVHVVQKVKVKNGEGAGGPGASGAESGADVFGESGCFFILFFSRNDDNTSSHTCPKHNTATNPTQNVGVTCWKSRSTSYLSGVSPSAPETRERSHHSATARAAEHALIEPTHSPSLLSTRRSNRPSWRAFALASRPTNCLASSNHRPATSIPRTTNRAWARGPTSSGTKFGIIQAWPPQVWPDQVWPRPRFGQTKFGPSLARSHFGSRPFMFKRCVARAHNEPFFCVFALGNTWWYAAQRLVGGARRRGPVRQPPQGQGPEHATVGPGPQGTGKFPIRGRWRTEPPQRRAESGAVAALERALAALGSEDGGARTGLEEALRRVREKAKDAPNRAPVPEVTIEAARARVSRLEAALGA